MAVAVVAVEAILGLVLLFGTALLFIFISKLSWPFFIAAVDDVTADTVVVVAVFIVDVAVFAALANLSVFSVLAVFACCCCCCCGFC